YKDWLYILVLIILAIYIPHIMLFYLVCGLIDFTRSKVYDFENWKRYFIGNGLLTWILSPFNLLMDLLSYKNKRIYKLEDLPNECQQELNKIFEIAQNKPEIIDTLSSMMEEKRRGMIFFKWYGRNINTSINIQEFHEEFKYVNTIGVSIFNKNQRTSVHYGPLRVTFRVLYNLIPAHNDNIYIKVAEHIHKWHDNPAFVFDDTLVHQSVNDSDNFRYVLFIDILRPGRYLKLMKFLLNILRFCLISVNRIFYKNWDMIK
ncbi:MAG: aspartyl/asparaginyl beta-hydroxylase domain-containing protein, partial [Burkholderiales bacterium]|nr:aspartyl/asparaginyl beta-hydroxylase domain-containing protein [Burkholderiales bacterium]